MDDTFQSIKDGRSRPCWTFPGIDNPEEATSLSNDKLAPMPRLQVRRIDGDLFFSSRSWTPEPISPRTREIYATAAFEHAPSPAGQYRAGGSSDNAFLRRRCLKVAFQEFGGHANVCRRRNVKSGKRCVDILRSCAANFAGLTRLCCCHAGLASLQRYP